MDMDTIRPGRDFAEDIAVAPSGSAVCLALIGRPWESITLPYGKRRLEEPNDFVRLEVAAAIREGLRVLAQPRLVGLAKSLHRLAPSERPG